MHHKTLFQSFNNKDTRREEEKLKIKKKKKEKKRKFSKC